MPDLNCITSSFLLRVGFLLTFTAALLYFALIATSSCIGYWAGRSSKLSNIRAINTEPENTKDEYKLVNARPFQFEEASIDLC